MGALETCDAWFCLVLGGIVVLLVVTSVLFVFVGIVCAVGVRQLFLGLA